MQPLDGEVLAIVRYDASVPVRFVHMAFPNPETHRLSLALELLSIGVIDVVVVRSSGAAVLPVEIRLDAKLRPAEVATVTFRRTDLVVALSAAALGALKVFLLRGHARGDIFDVNHIDFEASAKATTGVRTVDVTFAVEKSVPAISPSELRRTL